MNVKGMDGGVDKVLGVVDWFCVLPCIFLKVPQIFTILANRSAKGLSLRGYAVGFSRFIFTIIYHIKYSYPLMTWLEYPFLVIQDLICVPLIMYFQKVDSTMIAYSSFALSTYIAVLLLSPLWIIDLIQMCFIPIGFFGKYSHLSEMYITKDTRNVSFSEWFLNGATCLGRVITYYVLLGDYLLITKMSVNAAVNFIGCCMIVYYYPRPKKTD